MSELDDRLIEGREAVASMGPPEDLWARVAERSTNRAAVHELAVVPPRRRASFWLAVAAAAACLAVVALTTLVMSDRDLVETTDPSNSSGSSSATMHEGAESRVLSGYFRLIDGPLAGGTLHVTGNGEDGKWTGTLGFSEVHAGMVVTLDCVDIATDGFIVWGGRVTTPPHDGTSVVGDRLFLVVREDEPTTFNGEKYANDSVMIADGDAAGSCSELLQSTPGDLLSESTWSRVSNGHDLETGDPSPAPPSSPDLDAPSRAVFGTLTPGARVEFTALPKGSERGTRGPGLEDERVRIGVYRSGRLARGNG